MVYEEDEKLLVKGYSTNASFQTDRDNSVSLSGFLFCLNISDVSWNSSEQEH